MAVQPCHHTRGESTDESASLGRMRGWAKIWAKIPTSMNLSVLRKRSLQRCPDLVRVQGLIRFLKRGTTWNNLKISVVLTVE